MFFFELFIFLCFSQFPSIFSLTNLFSIIPFSLSADHPRHSKTKEKQDFDSTDTVHMIDAAPKWRNTIRDGPIAD